MSILKKNNTNTNFYECWSSEVDKLCIIENNRWINKLQGVNNHTSFFMLSTISFNLKFLSLLGSYFWFVFQLCWIAVLQQRFAYYYYLSSVVWSVMIAYVNLWIITGFNVHLYNHWCLINCLYFKKRNNTGYASALISFWFKPFHPFDFWSREMKFVLCVITYDSLVYVFISKFVFVQRS